MPGSSAVEAGEARPPARVAAAARAHARAVSAYADAALAVRPELWLAPRAPGKWSPAEITAHLALVHDAGVAELAGGPPMALRTTRWQRVLLRYTLMPVLLAGGRFPRNVRAPREVRPVPAAAVSGEDPAACRDAAVAAFNAGAAAFARAVLQAAAERPRARFTHAYFGGLALHQALRFCAVHIDHHRAQLPPV
jgi:hypothetical protein